MFRCAGQAGGGPLMSNVRRLKANHAELRSLQTPQNSILAALRVQAMHVGAIQYARWPVVEAARPLAGSAPAWSLVRTEPNRASDPGYGAWKLEPTTKSTPCAEAQRQTARRFRHRPDGPCRVASARLRCRTKISPHLFNLSRQAMLSQPSETPNPSIERTATGLAPRSVQVHDPLRGANPAAASHVKR
jgi:hypothetical protein